MPKKVKEKKKETAQACWDRIKQVIRADATARNQYRTENGDMCVLGGLADAANIPYPELDASENEQHIHAEGLGVLHDGLLREYPVLSSWRLTKLQTCNDKYHETDERRTALLSLCDQFTLEPIENENSTGEQR